LGKHTVACVVKAPLLHHPRGFYRGLALSEPDGFQAIAGHGLEARIDDHSLLVGNRKLLADRGISLDGLEARAEELAASGRTPMYAAVDGRVAGLVAVADGRSLVLGRQSPRSASSAWRS
jgi:cation transport ATPase